LAEPSTNPLAATPTPPATALASPALPPVALGFAPGDVVVVTGAGSGIGRSAARSAAAVGLAVAAWDLNPDTVHSVVAEITAAGGRAVACVADVTDDTAVAAALDRSQTLGPIRYLLNNAGPANSSPLTFDAGLVAAVGSMRRVTEAWLARPRPPGGAVVNLASVAGTTIGAAPDWYSAAKAAVLGWTRYLAAQRTGEVRANAVAPGLIATPRTANLAASDLGQHIQQRIPLGRSGQPDEVAWVCLFLLSPLAAYVNGTLVVVDGGWTVAQ
jgi:NAD(P)-dependent dehydrogenase (short-subunit alcohol dehydrogenase family)